MADQRGINSMVDVARVALGLSLAAACRLDEALAPLQQGATTMAARGQPPELANALLCLARVLGAAGDTAGMAATLAKARSALASCPDPGMVGDSLATLELPHPARPGFRERHRQRAVRLVQHRPHPRPVDLLEAGGVLPGRRHRAGPFPEHPGTRSHLGELAL